MKKNIIIASLAISLITTGLVSTSCVAAKPKIGAIGTTQWAGGDGVFKRPYSLGNKGSKMNITLKSAEYTVGQVLIDSEVYFPKDNEKLLVLHYTVHNPEKREQTIGWNTFYFTAVDSEDANHEFIQNIGQETNKKKLNMRLKPAQRAEVYTIIRVGANGEVPKLIVKRGPGLVLRYDLRGKVKPLPTEYADPSDTTGATVMSTISGSFETYYHADDFDFKVNSVEVKTETVGDAKPGKNKALALVNVTLKNVSPRDINVGWTALKPELTTDAGSGKWFQNVFDAKFFEKVSNLKIDSGEETNIVYIFEIKAESNPDVLTINTRNKLVYKYLVSKSGEG